MIPIEEEMKGKVAIITGANTGIGFGCAKVFSEAGMNVVMAARRKEKGEAAAAELNAAGKGECTFFQCDVSDPDQVKALIDFAVEKYGRLDTMVNNAGYNPIHMDACDMSIESYQRVLATNLMGEFYGCKFAIPHLRKTKGSIINMSSILSKVGQEQTAGYSSTKGGINLDRCNHYSWLGRGGQPEEVGTAALFLASSWAGYITGVTLNVSGGMEFGTIPKYYAFDASAEKMKNNTQEEN